ACAFGLWWQPSCPHFGASCFGASQTIGGGAPRSAGSRSPAQPNVDRPTRLERPTRKVKAANWREEIGDMSSFSVGGACRVTLADDYLPVIRRASSSRSSSSLGR